MKRYVPHFSRLFRRVDLYRARHLVQKSERPPAGGSLSDRPGTCPIDRGMGRVLEYFGKTARLRRGGEHEGRLLGHRPKPEYGTSRYGSSDTHSRAKAARLAAYARRLAAWLMEERPTPARPRRAEPPPLNSMKVNSFTASRRRRRGIWSAAARLSHDPWGAQKPLAEDILTRSRRELRGRSGRQRPELVALARRPRLKYEADGCAAARAAGCAKWCASAERWGGAGTTQPIIRHQQKGRGEGAGVEGPPRVVANEAGS